ncbi:hypothetical protein DSM104443_01365 [Usitatibacter rugosus]|uniref:Beta-barrel assembly machine subunit BamE n=1 Tax=Usitatibacter rugosus TaxID=2732067 RepID=A0A6M4GSJ9_9PROT|nr:hypothetical protein [Usitatibacter rugosus]QJR10310.1 hypothetical protein DSM104443_01365 [Usitatibacter rugosus]
MKPTVTLLAALIVAACTPMASIPPGTPEAQARGAFGAPAAEFDYPDGTHQLVYPRGPLGTETYMVFLKGGTVQRVEQALTDDNFYRIQAGVTTAEQVRRMIGPPSRVVRFENLQQFAWDYRFRDTWGYLAIFSVMIDDRGMVASKVIARIESSKDGGMNR